MDRCGAVPDLARYDETFPSQSSYCDGEYIKSRFFKVGDETPAPPNMGTYYFKPIKGACSSPGGFSPFKYFKLIEIGGAEQFALGSVAN